MSDSGLYGVETSVTEFFVAAGVLWVLIQRLRRNRPGLGIGAPIAVAFAIRVLAAVGVAATPFARTLRGPDELFFLAQAKGIASQSFGSQTWPQALTTTLHEFLFALQFRLFGDVPQLALRIPMICLAVAGIALFATAAYELAGRRGALAAAWLLAFEPTNVFFSSFLHKEPLLLFAEGLVAFGGTLVWRRGRLAGLLPMALGCAVAFATRTYAAWFLIGVCAAITLHSAIRTARAQSQLSPRSRRIRAVVLFGLVTVLLVAAAPVVWRGTSDQSLKELQISQDANATGGSNLALEPVDFSSRDKVLINLPTRIRDIVLRPYPWQLGNTSQQLGLLGTLVLWPALLAVVVLLGLARPAIMARAGPLVYLAIGVLITYALSAGNAGTAFRYRTHVVGLVLVLGAVLWAARRNAAADARRLPPAPATATAWARAPVVA